MYRQAVGAVNGHKSVKARVVTFTDTYIFSSFATEEVAVIFVRFYQNRTVSTDLIKCLEYEMVLTLLLAMKLIRSFCNCIVKAPENLAELIWL